MFVSAVHHVSSVDELISGSSHAQLLLSVTQNHLPPGRHKNKQLTVTNTLRNEVSADPHLVSMPTGVKSSLCLLWKKRVLVLISRIAGG